MKERIIIFDGDTGYDLDMYPRRNVNITYSVNEVGSLADRSSTFSNTFKIPRTANNMALLDNLGTVGNDSNKPYIQNPCNYMIGTTVLIKNGRLQITKTTDTEYSIVLYEGLIDLSIQLGNSTVAELDYSEFDHFLDSTASVTSTFSNTEGYIYALGEFGKAVANTVDCEKLAPSIFASTVWDKIFTSNGLTYAGDFFTANAEWKQLLVPPTKGIDITEVPLTATSIGTSTTDLLSVNNDYESWVNLNSDMNFSTDGYNTNATINGGGDIAMNYTGTIELNITTTYTQVSTDLKLLIFLDGNTFPSKTLNISPNTSPVAHAPVLLETTPSTVIKLVVQSNPNTSGGYPPASFDHEYTATCAVQINTMAGGTEIKVDDYMTQSLTQIDFIKDILQRYGLVMIRDRDVPTNYVFFQMEELLGDGVDVIDWTDKYIMKVDESYNSGYAQKNFADYQYLSGVEPFLTGFIELNNEFSVLEDTIIASTYEVPLQDGTLHAKPKYVIPVWEEKDSVIQIAETTSKIMRTSIGNQDVTFRLFGGVGVNYTDPIAYLSLENMGYDYFFSNYYGRFEQMLSSYKKIIVEVDLNLLDLTNIDFTKLHFLKQTGRYYYLDSIKTRGETSIATLIEVPNPNA